MRITTSSFFCDPGYRFSISHKVNLFIRQKLNEMIIVPYGIDKEKPKTLINLLVTTSSDTTRLEVKGPDYNKRDNFINWGLWLPYKEITKAKDQLIPYIQYFFEATIIVLKNYGVSGDDVRKVQSMVESEVINNSEYIFEEEEIPEIDLSDLEL